ncbi:MAG: FtsX-like permease family protein, partial [Blastocatellia bacterium]
LEIAIRAAMGATRWRIIRQLLTENALLALLGGALGILMALWMLALMKTSIPPEITSFIPGYSRMAINTRALGFTFVIALLAGIVSGLAPAFRASKPDLNEALKEGKRSSGAGVGHSRLRGLLVISEVALALTLLVGAGLMVKGFTRLSENMKRGLSPENVLTMGVSLSRTRYPEAHQVRAYYQQSLERIEKLPEVVSAGAATFLPASGGWRTVDLFIAGRPDPAPEQSQSANLQAVTPHYFQTLRIPIIEGRDFADRDQADSPRVAIVSAELQRRYFPDEEPLGKRIRVGSPASDWATIVGVVGDVMRFHFDKRRQPAVYLPHSQSPARAMYLVARASDNPLGLAAAVRAQALSVDKEQPVFDITTVEKAMTDEVSGVRLGAMLMALFGLIALLLSAVGVYGVITYSVEQRTHEIGIRMALGAQPRDVLKLVVGRGLALALIGVGIGLIAAFGLTRLMANLLFGVSATDVLTFVLMPLLLGAIALLACYIPARRAARVDPLVALRHE